jgi:hypothetical protein
MVFYDDSLEAGCKLPPEPLPAFHTGHFVKSRYDSKESSGDNQEFIAHENDGFD